MAILGLQGYHHYETDKGFSLTHIHSYTCLSFSLEYFQIVYVAMG